MSNFHPHEVVGRGSETQLQVGEKLSEEAWRFQCTTYRGSIFQVIESDI